ncbi:MAG: hypothetical protein RL213_1852 [Bacteroidota bacterium]|jgi:dTDP-4-dehydrorhamnose reductase
MKTVLVTGGNGLLGQKVVYDLVGREGVRCISTGLGKNRMALKEGYVYQELDVTDRAAVLAAMERWRPDAVVHTAALTNVDACEQRREEAVLINVTAVHQLAEICRDFGTHLVHLSTDFVFDGNDGPYAESDPLHPLSHYAVTKAEGERRVMEAGGSWSILRTIIIYGVVDDNSRSNVVLWVYNALKQGREITVIKDQFRSPTLAEDLARACVSAALSRSQGIYHVSGRETMCILDMALIVADFFGLDPSPIRPIASAELRQPALRPPVTGFIIRKAERELDFRPSTFLEGLAVVKKQLLVFGDS